MFEKRDYGNDEDFNMYIPAHISRESKYRPEKAKEDLKTARDNYCEESYRASVNCS